MATLHSTLVSIFLVFCEKIEFPNAKPLVRDVTVAADAQEFPFVVSIGWKKTDDMREDETHSCGGALITKRHVLTAAHCKNDVDDIEDVRVKIGSNDLLKSKEYKVNAWDTFDDWTFRNHEVPEHLRGNDISVITLSKATKIKSACISNISNEAWIGKTAVTAGWGYRKNEKRTRFMEKAALNVSSRIECQRKIAETSLANEVLRVPHRYLCTNANPHVVLGLGDSGSPLIVNNNIVIGINKSSAPRQSRSVFEEQNLHVGVQYYVELIRNITESTNSKTCLWNSSQFFGCCSLQ